MQSLLDKDYKRLDEVFERIFEIYSPSNKMGVDRVFIHPKTRFRFTVQYHVDYAAGKSGICYIQTWDQAPDESHAGKRGWSYATLAQIVIYYIPEREIALFISGNTIKYYVVKWDKDETFPTTSTGTQEGNRMGIRVPIDALTGIAYTTITIPNKE